MSHPPNLLRTPLYDLAIAAGARMTEFAGWEMAIQYAGVKKEHQAVRSAVGMFDISHMGKFELVGEDVVAAFAPLVPTDLTPLTPGKAQYSVLLNEQGGIIDDIIFYLQAFDRAMVIVNAATTEKDRQWLGDKLPGITLCDRSQEQGLIALQGPQAVELFQTLSAIDFSGVPAFGHGTGTLFNEPIFWARTGYTGEDGLEIMASPRVTQQLWQTLLAKNVIPCGLGARDTLRLEAAMGLYGQDMDDGTSPLEAGLKWLVHGDRPDNFIGKGALAQQQHQGLPRRLVGLKMEGRHIARHGYPVWGAGEPVGEITSGTFSPTLETAIALAYVPPKFAKVGQSLQVEIRGKQYPAQVVKKPFYRRGQ